MSRDGVADMTSCCVCHKKCERAYFNSTVNYCESCTELGFDETNFSHYVNNSMYIIFSLMRVVSGLHERIKQLEPKEPAE